MTAALFFLVQLVLRAQVVPRKETCVCEVYQQLAEQEYRNLKKIKISHESSIRAARKWSVQKSTGRKAHRKRPKISWIDRCTEFR